MTPYSKLQLHLERHMYKRGRFKGEAPADSSRRGKSHFRVGKQGDTMCVTMYHTNLIEVTPDNNVRISMNGWWTNTTKANINEAMHKFLGWGGIGSVLAFGMSQLCIRAKGKTYKFYDGMEFDGEGNLLSLPARFDRRQTNRDATAEFRKDIEESGFKGAFPVLFAATEPMRGWWGNSLEKVVTRECHANEWPVIAADFKRQYDTHQEAYRAIVRQCTANMKEIVTTDVTLL